MTTEPLSLVIVEDDERLAETLAAEFSDRGYRVEHASDLESLRAIAGRRFDRAIIDLRLRHDNGIDAVAIIREVSPNAKVVMLTGYGSIATAVEATKRGVTNYLTKPADIDSIERAFSGEQAPVPDDFPSLARHEREYIEYVLAESGGNITHAAQRLGVHRQSLQRKLRKYTPR